MKVYGNLMNRIEENMVATPKVGDGATIYMYSDRHACTVIAVSPNGKQVVIQQDKAIRTDNNGMSDAQNYRYERDPQGTIYVVSKRKDGRYKIVKDGTVVGFGRRDEYYDYSF